MTNSPRKDYHVFAATLFFVGLGASFLEFTAPSLLQTRMTSRQSVGEYYYSQSDLRRLTDDYYYLARDPSRNGERPFTTLSAIQKDPRLSKLASLLEDLDVASYFDREHAFTFFAPTNEAFEGNNLQDIRAKLETNPYYLENLLRYHIAPDWKEKEDFTGHGWMPTSAGPWLPISRGRHTEIAGARIISYDNFTTSGVVHLVDKLFDLTNAREQGSF